MTQAIASGRPAYELRSRQRGPSDLELEVWQVPSTATPELKEPRRIAGLGGHKLLLVEGSVLRRLKAEQVSLAKLKKGEGRRDALSEDLALSLGLANVQRQRQMPLAVAVQHLTGANVASLACLAACGYLAHTRQTQRPMTPILCGSEAPTVAVTLEGHAREAPQRLEPGLGSTKALASPLPVEGWSDDRAAQAAWAQPQ